MVLVLSFELYYHISEVPSFGLKTNNSSLMLLTYIYHTRILFPFFQFQGFFVFFKEFHFYLFIYLFIYLGCVGSSFLHRGVQASHYRGLSYCGAQAPDAQAQ